MRAIESVPPTALRRAAAIARGPHACPSCECPTFAEPPVPWVGLRDFFVRCDSCDRPLHVRVERDHVLRLESAPRAISRAPGMYDPVAELLDGGGRRAFVDRVAAAAWLPLLVALFVLGTGGTECAMLAWWLAVAASLPAAVCDCGRPRVRRSGLTK